MPTGTEVHGGRLQAPMELQGMGRGMGTRGAGFKGIFPLFQQKEMKERKMFSPRSPGAAQLRQRAPGLDFGPFAGRTRAPGGGALPGPYPSWHGMRMHLGPPVLLSTRPHGPGTLAVHKRSSERCWPRAIHHRLGPYENVGPAAAGGGGGRGRRCQPCQGRLNGAVINGTGAGLASPSRRLERGHRLVYN